MLTAKYEFNFPLFDNSFRDGNNHGSTKIRNPS